MTSEHTHFSLAHESQVSNRTGHLPTCINWRTNEKSLKIVTAILRDAIVHGTVNGAAWGRRQIGIRLFYR
jgi:hypothetical protein